MEDMINCRGAGFEAPSPHLRFPGRLLRPDELRELQAIASFLRERCNLISPIAGEFEERLAVSTMPRRCKDCAAIQLCPEWKFLPKYQAKDGFQDDSQGRSTSSTTDEMKRSCVTGCLGRTGYRGRSGDNPIDAILWDARALISKIETLSHTGFLQTISPHIADRTSIRLSDGGRLHALTDISIDSNEPPLFPGTKCVLYPADPESELHEPQDGHDFQEWDWRREETPRKTGR